MRRLLPLLFYTTKLLVVTNGLQMVFERFVSVPPLVLLARVLAYGLSAYGVAAVLVAMVRKDPQWRLKTFSGYQAPFGVLVRQVVFSLVLWSACMLGSLPCVLADLCGLPILAPFALVLAVGLIVWAYVRLSFFWFVSADDRASPLASLVNAFRLTSGRVGEILRLHLAYWWVHVVNSLLMAASFVFSLPHLVPYLEKLQLSVPAWFMSPALQVVDTSAWWFAICFPIVQAAVLLPVRLALAVCYRQVADAGK